MLRFRNKQFNYTIRQNTKKKLFCTIRQNVSLYKSKAIGVFLKVNIKRQGKQFFSSLE
jgi:hypothetical protein